MTTSKSLADACGPRSEPAVFGAYHTEPTSSAAFNALRCTAKFWSAKKPRYLAVIDVSLANSKNNARVSSTCPVDF